MTLIDSAIAGILSLSVAGNTDVTLTSVQGAPDQARNQHFVFTGALTGNINVFWPLSRNRFFSVKNATTGAFSLTIAVVGSPGTTVVVPQGETVDLASDGTNITTRFNSFVGGLTTTGGASIDTLTLLTSLVFTRPTVGGTGNAILLTYSPVPASYVNGAKYEFVATAANSGATQVNINGLGLKNVFRRTPTGIAACIGGEIENGDIVEIEYDGTQFQLINQAANAGSFTGGTLTSTLVMSGAAFNEAYVSSAAAVSAGVLDISAVQANNIDLTQTSNSAISSFGNVPGGSRRIVRFIGATPGALINSGNLSLPNGAQISMGQNDVAELFFSSLGVANLVSYTRYVGAPVYGAASAAETLTGTDATKFLTAAGFAGNKSLASNGFYKFPGGLILQWGVVAVGGNSQATVTFPTAFAATGVSLVATYGDVGSSAAIPTIGVGGEFISLSQCIIANGSGNAHSIYWMALGV
jgi:hypothetical protein